MIEIGWKETVKKKRALASENQRKKKNQCQEIEKKRKKGGFILKELKIARLELELYMCVCEKVNEIG